MHRRSVDARRYDLHRVVMSTVGANGLNAAVVGPEQPVSTTQGVASQRSSVGRIDVDHHLVDALPARLGQRTISGQTELTAQGGLHIGPFHNLALNDARPHRLFAQQLDAQPIAVYAGHMANSTQYFPG